MNADILLSREIILGRVRRILCFIFIGNAIGIYALITLIEETVFKARAGSSIVDPPLVLFSEHCRSFDIHAMRGIVLLSTWAEVFIIVLWLILNPREYSILPFSTRFAMIRTFMSVYQWFLPIYFVVVNTECMGIIILCGRIPPVELMLWLIHAVSLWWMPTILQQLKDIDVLIA